jgi:hypothetical protein
MIARRTPTFHDQLMSLLLANTRPVQAIMALCGVIAAAGLYAAQSLHTWTPMDQFIEATSYGFTMSLFIIYAIMSWTSALLDRRTPPWIYYKYIATCMGIGLWTICLGSSIVVHQGQVFLRDGMSFLYIVPTSADAWVLIQMIGGVELVERRLWK